MPMKPGTSKIIRLSTEVVHALGVRKPGESWDTYMRRFLGIPSKDGALQHLRTYWVVPIEKPLIGLYRAEARGLRLIEKVKRGKDLPNPIRVKEMLDENS